MTLSQQFFLITLLPLSFLIMIVYLWWVGSNRRQVSLRWTFCLLMATAWASSLLRFFGGLSFTNLLVFNWGVFGTYALTLTAVGLLLTTSTYLLVNRGQSRVAVVITLLLLGTAVVLDPDIWNYYLPFVRIGGQRVGQFNLWGAVWIASWLLPIIASWLLTQQTKSNLPASIYRNQVNYWQLVIALFFIGFGLASVRLTTQPGWQQLGILIAIIAASVGTMTLTRTHLLDLQLASRQLLSRLAGTLIIFGFTWLALSYLVRSVTSAPAETASETQNLILIIAAALFAALFTLVYRGVNNVTRRIFLREKTTRSVAQNDFSNVIGNLPESAQLGQMFLRMVQSNLATDDAWLFTTDDGPGGKLILRPLAALGETATVTSDFQPESPFTLQLRQRSEPLLQSDIDTLKVYDELPESERAMLNRWQRVLYKPLRAGDSLIGVLALSTKYTGEGYDDTDLALLYSWAEQLGPLLAQAQNLASLRLINDFVFRENQQLVREKQHLEELVQLYVRFVDLVSPELRRPFTDLNQEMVKYQASVSESDSQIMGEINQQVTALRAPIDNLITVSTRIQMRDQFDFKPLHLDRLAQEVMRNLHTMAEARRVKIDLQLDPTGSSALGDEQQLLEAIQHLLHNAIKFNKIGGMIVIECGSEGNETFLRVIDNGVGIPEERLETMESGLHPLHANGNGRRTGLGLALTQFIVKAHGGRLSAESKYGTGSTFSLYLPLLYED